MVQRTLQKLERERNDFLLHLRTQTGDSQIVSAVRIGINQHTLSKLETSNGSPVTSEGLWTNAAQKIATFYGMLPEDIWPEHAPEIVSFNDNTFYTGEDTLTPEEMLANTELGRIAKTSLATLDDRLRDIIVSRESGETFASIGKRYHLSRERIRQICNQTIETLTKNVLTVVNAEKQVAPPPKKEIRTIIVVSSAPEKPKRVKLPKPPADEKTRQRREKYKAERKRQERERFEQSVYFTRANIEHITGRPVNTNPDLSDVSMKSPTWLWIWKFLIQPKQRVSGAYDAWNEIASVIGCNVRTQIILWYAGIRTLEELVKAGYSIYYLGVCNSHVIANDAAFLLRARQTRGLIRTKSIKPV